MGRQSPQMRVPRVLGLVCSHLSPAESSKTRKIRFSWKKSIRFFPSFFRAQIFDCLFTDEVHAGAHASAHAEARTQAHHACQSPGLVRPSAPPRRQTQRFDSSADGSKTCSAMLQRPGDCPTHLLVPSHIRVLDGSLIEVANVPVIIGPVPCSLSLLEFPVCR